jgi:hypothetical protein
MLQVDITHHLPTDANHAAVHLYSLQYDPEYGLSLLYLSVLPADGKSNKQWWASKTRENAFALHAF